MKVNTQMGEALGNDFARDIDNLATIVNEVNDLEAQIADVDSFLSNQNILPEQTKALTALKTQLNTQLIVKNKMMTQAFEDTIKKVQGYQVQINTANANLGSRYARLEMVEERLTAQYTEYEELLSENIDADLVETYINLTSADNVYNASLQTAAKIAQNSLLDFIN
jgi:flagellar hook-associated protein 3 FlgL